MAAPRQTPPPGGLRIAHGQAMGARDHQEDSLRVTQEAEGVLGLVADGMGGHAAGDVASHAAADGFMAAFRGRPGLPIVQRLSLGLTAANRAVADALESGRGGAGMGCTVSAAFADKETVAWISVGDSPILLWAPGRPLRRISADHSMAPVLDEMARKGLMTPAEAEADPDRNALRSAVRGQAIELTDTGSTPLPPGALLVVASDGLDVLSPVEIARHLERAEGDPDKAVADLLSAVAVLNMPEQDNVSIVAIANPAAIQSPPPNALGALNWKIPAAIGLVAVLVLIAVIAYLFLRGGQ